MGGAAAYLKSLGRFVSLQSERKRAAKVWVAIADIRQEYERLSIFRAGPPVQIGNNRCLAPLFRTLTGHEQD
jgi:hypothetical protein